MNNGLIVFLLSAAVLSGATQSTPSASTTLRMNGTTTLRMNGTIDRFDASTRILSLSTSNGTVQFPVASAARIRQGWHKVEPLELQKLAGYRATVRYSESAGNKIVESVHVFGKNERSER
jgi:GDP-D-mannose dehydratase